MRSARGDIILGWLFKVVAFLALLGVPVFEAGAIVVARVQVDGIAANAADDAALEFGSSGSTAKAQSAAERIARVSGAEIVAFTVYREQDIVRVRVRKVARTFFLQRIAATRKYTVATSTHDGTIR